MHKLSEEMTDKPDLELDIKDAIELFNELNNTIQFNSGIQFALGWCYLRNREFKKATELFNSSSWVDLEDYARFYLAKCYEAQANASLDLPDQRKRFLTLARGTVSKISNAQLQDQVDNMKWGLQAALSKPSSRV